MKIKNSREYSIDGKWSKPGSSFYDNLMEEDNWRSLINEAFLVSNDDIKNTEEDSTTFAGSGCKYPHHVIRNGKLVVHAEELEPPILELNKWECIVGKLKSILTNIIEN